jgi:hypothetical protein
MIFTHESAAKTHRTPKALRAKFKELDFVSRKLSECGAFSASLSFRFAELML